jgi:hypothetical protein
MRARMLGEYCMEMGYVGLAELFRNKKTERIAIETVEGEIAQHFVEKGVVVQDAGSFRLLD